MTCSKYSPCLGDAVWTEYGAGVIVGSKDPPLRDSSTTPLFFQVRLWRLPGKSIGSSSLAYLDAATILEKLPAAPGMVAPLLTASKGESKDDDAEDNKENVLVQAYYHKTKTYLVSRVEPDAADTTKSLTSTTQSTSWQVSVDDIGPAPSAKFAPMLEALMVRADETGHTAAQFLQKESTQKMICQTQQTLTEQMTTAQKYLANHEKDATTSAALKVESLYNTVAEAVETHKPSEQQVKQVLTMVKDQELTELLKNCRERLEKLVQKEIPKATVVALEKTGIKIKSAEDGNDTDTDTEHSLTFAASMNASRKAALIALQELMDKAHALEYYNNAATGLADAQPQLETVRNQITSQFSATFDSLANAAKSDASLNELFQELADKTTVWQQATGRLLQTRSASLFLEGASRLQARAATILKMQWTGGGEIGSKLTKAFTEKDAALARLKSIQLGDAVKTRLVQAIEVRSESLGGLDGIIAGALAKGQALAGQTSSALGSGAAQNNQIQTMLSQLQASASTATANAHETLIGVLSRRNMFRDVALLRIERVFCELSHQLGENDLSMDDMYAMARGEGGTAKLFQPIARRAMQQIEKQLEVAETQVQGNETMLEVLKRVRKITSGELTVAALTEELVGILNDEKIVAASETVFQHGEQVLDAIEGVSSNKIVNDALKIVEKAGITKDSVMKQFENIDVDQLLDTAGSAVTDERKRLELVSSATDMALDFVLRILPSMPVPPFDGVRDGLLYNISNLSMEGFKVRKKDIQIELAGMRATQRRIKQSPSRLTSSGDSSSGYHTATSNEEDDDDDSMPDVIVPESGFDESEDMDIEKVATKIKATELLIIDVKRISSVMNDVSWSFEQTYLPYLKGQGLADIKLSDGAIRLQFELRRRKKQSVDSSKENGEVQWEPVLCLHDRTCSIGEMELNFQGEGRITWIFNKLASIFKGPLRDYVVKTIVRVLSNQSGWILERMNSLLSPYWDLILKTAKLDMDGLIEADDAVVVKAEASDPSLVELVWRERLPLGMNLLMNDESGKLKVVDFPRGSQARLVAEKRDLDPDLFKGATILGVNGTMFDELDDLFEALKEPSRPKTIQFRLAESAESERVRKFVEGGQRSSAETDEENESRPRKISTRVIEFEQDGELGIVFEAAIDNCGLVVEAFLEGPDGIALAAERSNEIHLGDLLTHVNGQLVVGTNGKGRQKTLDILEQVVNNRPLTLSFVRSYLFRDVITRPPEVPGLHENGGPDELVLVERKLENGSRRVLIKNFNPVSGAVESSGILIGDHLVFVNGTPVGAGARWMGEGHSPSLEEVYEMLCDKSFYPIGLTFARPQANSGASSRWTSKNEQPFSDFDADTICVTCDEQNRLGCIFDVTDHGDIVISDFNSVPGLFHRKLARHIEVDGLHIAIDSINGQFVPSYATKDMVMNGLKRSWNSYGRVEIILCDDEKKQYVQSLS